MQALGSRELQGDTELQRKEYHSHLLTSNSCSSTWQCSWSCGCGVCMLRPSIAAAKGPAEGGSALLPPAPAPLLLFEVPLRGRISPVLCEVLDPGLEPTAAPCGLSNGATAGAAAAAGALAPEATGGDPWAGRSPNAAHPSSNARAALSLPAMLLLPPLPNSAFQPANPSAPLVLL